MTGEGVVEAITFFLKHGEDTKKVEGRVVGSLEELETAFYDRFPEESSLGSLSFHVKDRVYGVMHKLVSTSKILTRYLVRHTPWLCTHVKLTTTTLRIPCIPTVVHCRRRSAASSMTAASSKCAWRAARRRC
jgi:hypothetical protein